MAMLSFLLLTLASVITISQSRTFIASNVLSTGVTYQIDIGAIRTTVTVTIPSPITAGYGIGFGSSTSMDGTYAVIYDVVGGTTPRLTERILGTTPNRPGTEIGSITLSDQTNPDVTWSMDNIENIGGNTVITISRDNTVATSSFQFDRSATSLPVIYAQGPATGLEFYNTYHASRAGQVLSADPDSFETCVDNVEIVPGSGITLSIGRNTAYDTMKITMTGSLTTWFAFAFGGITNKMRDSYCITVAGTGQTSPIVERTLAASGSAGTALPDSLGTVVSTITGQTITESSSRTVELIRPMSGGPLDFTDFLTCKDGVGTSLNVCSAKGGAEDLAYHGNGQTNRYFDDLVNYCCTKSPTRDPTSDPTSDPTKDPTTSEPTTAAPTTAEPTTSEPTTADPTTTEPTTSEPTTSEPTKTTYDGQTKEPTTSQPTTMEPTTSEPTTAEPTTAAPTTSEPTTSEPTTANPTTTAPTTSEPTTMAPVTAKPSIYPKFETCTDAFGFGDAQAFIGRNTEDQTMIIQITGPSDKWFGFGFGNTVMDGTYAIVVGATATERILSASSDAMSIGVGTTVESNSGDGISIDDDGSKRTVTITRPYTSTIDGVFDFKDWLDCTFESDELDIIEAIGSGPDVAYHANRATYKVIRTCDCDTSESTAEPSGAPTMEPVYTVTKATTESPDTTEEPVGDAANSIFHIINITLTILISLYFL